MEKEKKLKAFAEFYNKNTNDYFYKFEYHLLKEQLRGIDLSQKKILDIGCGKGMVAAYICLLYPEANVSAIDEDEGNGLDQGSLKIIHEAKSKFILNNLTILKKDFWEIDFELDSFDVILANDSLHHIVEYNVKDETQKQKENWLKAFLKIKKYLKPGGHLILREVSVFNFWNHTNLKLLFSHMTWEIHPSLKFILETLKEAGFIDVQYSYLVNYKLRILTKLLEKNFLYGYFLNPTFHISAQKKGK